MTVSTSERIACKAHTERSWQHFLPYESFPILDENLIDLMILVDLNLMLKERIIEHYFRVNLQLKKSQKVYFSSLATLELQGLTSKINFA